MNLPGDAYLDQEIDGDAVRKFCNLVDDWSSLYVVGCA